MAIHGIGVDLVEVDRVEGAIQRSGQRFLDRVFTAGEQADCGADFRPAMRFAARFAAKEAVAKALGTGIGKHAGWQDIEVVRLETGAPTVRLHGRAGEYAGHLGVTGIWLSMSHTRQSAVAQAVVEVK